jgi:CRISPR system Cascade subunit CasA
VFTAAALARGQGKTDGFHERVLPVPVAGARRLRTDTARVRARAAARLELAERIRSKVLFPALKEVVPDRELERFTGAFSDEVDRRFFPELWSALDSADDRAADLAWVTTLGALARDQLERAIATVPLPSSTRWQRISAADGKFGALLHRQLAPLSEGVTP